jgi:hypothetical protein
MCLATERVGPNRLNVKQGDLDFSAQWVTLQPVLAHFRFDITE